jgi:acyl carrier protein
MESEIKYKNSFVKTFNINESDCESLKYQDIAEWDSIGHMALIATLEDSFEIEMDIDDIIDFSSYISGKEILKKYNVEF